MPKKNLTILLIIFFALSIIASIATIQTAKADNINLEPLNLYATWENYPSDFTDHTFRDYSVIYESNAYSIRLEKPETDYGWEVDGQGINVQVGDNLFYSAYAKTNSVSNDNSPFSGARIGIDYYINSPEYGWGIGYLNQSYAFGVPNDYSGSPTDNGYCNSLNYNEVSWKIPLGTTSWTYLSMNVTVPSQYATYQEHDGSILPITPTQISVAVPWFDVRDTETGIGWFTQSNLQKNSENIEPTPTPSPTNTNSPTSTPFYPFISPSPTSPLSNALVLSYWVNQTYPNYSQNTNGKNLSAQLNYNFTDVLSVTNDTGAVKYGLTIHNIAGAGDFWSAKAIHFYYVLELYNNNTNEHIYAWFYIAHEDGTLYNTVQIKCGNQGTSVANPNSIINIGGSQYSVDTLSNNINFPIMIQRFTNQTGKTSYQVSNTTVARLWVGGGTTLTENTLFTENFTVTPGFWTNLNAKLYLGYDGTGQFNVTFDTLSIDENGPLFHKGSIITNPSVPQFDLFQFLGMFWNWIGIAWQFVLMVWNMFIMFLPFLPLLVVFWLAGTISLCVRQGSFDPMRMQIEFVINLVTGLVHAITGIISAIRDMLPVP